MKPITNFYNDVSEERWASLPKNNCRILCRFQSACWYISVLVRLHSSASAPERRFRMPADNQRNECISLPPGLTLARYRVAIAVLLTFWVVPSMAQNASEQASSRDDEIRELREAVRSLQTEVAELKRELHGPEWRALRPQFPLFCNLRNRLRQVHRQKRLKTQPWIFSIRRSLRLGLTDTMLTTSTARSVA